jgi:hypothetical protein
MILFERTYLRWANENVTFAKEKKNKIMMEIINSEGRSVRRIS